MRLFSDEKLLEFVKNKTNSVAWMVSNCNPPSSRQVFALKLKQYIPVDIYGWCKDFCTMRCDKDTDCDNMIKDSYKFYLSFENYLSIDYVTEKLFKVLDRHIIPVV